MLYDTSLGYNQPGVSYIGSLVIKVASIPLPIILNNIKISFAGAEDYSNRTTIAVLSIDVSDIGIITIETVQENLSALTSIEAVTIHTGNIVSLN
jgi:hypothetical protein